MCYNKYMVFRSSSVLPEFDAPIFECDLLNRPHAPTEFDQAMLVELRWWVDAWLDSGPNMGRMCRTIGTAESHLLLEPGVCSYAITDSGLLFATPFPAGAIAA